MEICIKNNLMFIIINIQNYTKKFYIEDNDLLHLENSISKFKNNNTNKKYFLLNIIMLMNMLKIKILKIILIY